MTDESTPGSVVALVALLVPLASFMLIAARFVAFPGSDPADLLMMATGAGVVAVTQAGLTLRRFRGIRAESLNSRRSDGPPIRFEDRPKPRGEFVDVPGSAGFAQTPSIDRR